MRSDAGSAATNLPVTDVPPKIPKSVKEQRLFHLTRAQEQLRKGKALLASYRAAGANYANFHWHIADSRALEEAVAYLRARMGLPVLTNEIGQPEGGASVLCGDQIINN